ncbi:MAG: hypothetical protein ACJAWQ_002753, partial [Paraglaciecola sp.]
MGKLVLSEFKSVEELQKRIALLERKAEREKKARKIAENQLERYSLEIYQTNQSLKSALAYSTKIRSELEYLGKSSMSIASELTLNEMIGKLVELTCEYCAAEYGFYFVTEYALEIGDTFNKAWSKELGWHCQSGLQRLIGDNLPFSKTDIVDPWFVSVANEVNHHYLKPLGYILYLNFALSGGKTGWLAFWSQMELIDEDIFPVLATARDNLTSGIQKRLTDERILRRNIQLQNLVNDLEKA